MREVGGESVIPCSREDEDQRLAVVAVGTLLIQHGLDRLLHLLGQHGRVRIETVPAAILQLLDQQQVRLLLCERCLLEQLDKDRLARSGARIVLVAETDFPPADFPIEQWQLCAMLPHLGDSAVTLDPLRSLLDCEHSPDNVDACGNCPLKSSLQRQKLPLSPREMAIFRAIGRGAGPSEIARQCGLSVKTVEGYRERIKIKLGLDGREALLLAARRWSRGYCLPHATPAAIGSRC